MNEGGGRGVPDDHVTNALQYSVVEDHGHSSSFPAPCIEGGNLMGGFPRNGFMEAGVISP